MIPIARPQMGPEEKQAVWEVLDSGMLTQGPRVKAFEETFASMCGVKHAIATSNGTTALHMALLAHGVGAGDEVIVPSFTFIASASSILYTGARPVFVDIDPGTFNLDPRLIKNAITSRTKAIIAVHLFGLMADMPTICAIANRHSLTVIEDACQAHGAEYAGKRAGSFGTGTFSFYPTKNITSAEGGMITTNDDGIADYCRMIRQHGMRRRYYQDDLGYNYRMTDVHAAIGLAQMGKLEMFNAARIANAAFYTQYLRGVTVPTIPEGYHHVFHHYTIRVPREHRDAFVEHLRKCGVGSETYYPVPIHKQDYYVKHLKYEATLPVSERASREVVSLPVHPALSPQDLETVVEAVNSFGRLP